MFSKKFEAISKEGSVHSTSTTDTAQDSGYHSDDTKEFSTIAEWFAEKDEFRVGRRWACETIPIGEPSVIEQEACNLRPRASRPTSLKTPSGPQHLVEFHCNKQTAIAGRHQLIKSRT